MPSQAYEIRQCEQPDCRFRFPSGNTEPGRLKCPICGAPTQPVLQAVAPPENQSPTQKHRPMRLEILLDNLRSTWNVGSMMRTADGAGIQRFYLCGITPTPEHQKVARTALGAEQALTWSWHPNGLDLADQLMAEGCALWALEAAPAARPLSSIRYPDDDQRIILVVGNEVYGVDPGLLERCERILCIPMRGIKRSLNAAVAFGIAVYALLESQ